MCTRAAGRCVDPTPHGVVAVLFFVVFTIISGLVLLSLFLGVVTMSMEAESQKFDRHKKRIEDVAVIVKEHGINSSQA